MTEVSAKRDIAATVGENFLCVALSVVLAVFIILAVMLVPVLSMTLFTGSILAVITGCAVYLHWSWWKKKDLLFSKEVTNA